MSPINLRRRRERRERKHKDEGVAADGSRSLHQVRRSVKDESGSLHRLRRSDRGRSRVRGKGRGKRKCISLKKRTLLSHLRRRRIKEPVTAAGESPDSTSEPPLGKEERESFSWRFFSNPAIRWTEEERDLGGVLGKQNYKVGRVFDPLSDSWVVKYNLVINPVAPGSSGIPVKIICDICGKPDHLRTTCSLTFRYPTDAPPFNRDDYELVCQCGSNNISPGAWNCNDCQPNCDLRVQPKELPPLLEYDNPDPDPSSYVPLYPDLEKLRVVSPGKFSVPHSVFCVLTSSSG